MEARNKTYNDLSFGGDQHNGSYTFLNNLKDNFFFLLLYYKWDIHEKYVKLRGMPRKLAQSGCSIN